MAKAVAETNKSALPAHLQGGKQNKFGNVDSSDVIVPRVKLLQLVSPEVADNENAKAGKFWHSIAGENLGDTLRGIPILVRKHVVLWAPRKDDRGILARASDGVHWDVPGLEFVVKPEKSPHEIKYVLGDRVDDRINGPALSEFGSSIPGDANSPPAASLTYDFLWYFPDLPELSPAIIINTRSSVAPAKLLISKIEGKPVDSFGQIYNIKTKKEGTATEPYFNYVYEGDGYADEDLYKIGQDLYDRYHKTMWRASDEDTGGEDVANSRGRGAPKGPSDSQNF